MKRARITIAGLCIIVGVSALIFAAVRDPNPMWVIIFEVWTVGLLGAALALVIRSRGRACWVGSAAFGLFVALFPAFGFRGWSEMDRPTTSLEYRSYAALHLGILRPLTCPDDDAASSRPGNLSYSVSGFQRWNCFPVALEETIHYLHFHRIFRCLEIWLAGLMGGLVGSACPAFVRLFRGGWMGRWEDAPR